MLIRPRFVWHPSSLLESTELLVFEQMYSQVYKKLKEGGCIGIFPEGRPYLSQLVKNQLLTGLQEDHTIAQISFR